MVLAVMVCVLVYRVYGVIQPQDIDTTLVPGYPRETPPPGIVGDPPVEPPPPPSEDWTSIHERSMFVYKPTGQQGAGGSASEADIVVKLIDIQETSEGQFVARIQTQGRPRSYRVNTKFEQFELLSIDPEAQCCEIFVEALGRAVTRCIEEKVGASP